MKKKPTRHLAYFNPSYVLDGLPFSGSTNWNSSPGRHYKGSKSSYRRFESLVQSGNYNVSCMIHNSGDPLFISITTKS